ncbi:peptidase S8 and S53 subtilisin kexin sedolisin [Haloterrigena turkmenica DSM 5511]|uniref:Peptidase S8 and S53 subtilisin kexin sedolisin n=1 Tax=Haloterrigena turkmenica (strain ATCC 51198 / DSM 5511 / JCM 9101 / NCIMB 13204 / VKM B-1734 / 4k) TaxID=543526 RepID=D2RTA1_HALTV|nr:S8 family serine peptidase [Haloterrigena turkmenica]ADB60981.1 peptidase S8 and S53 subtilisin kexin sedolisin [Haloterrigena turkmenica DSM 5511]
MELNRRSVLKGIGATGVSLTFAGFASAEGDARYIVTVENDRARDRLEAAEFAIKNVLAGGAVVVAVGREDAVDDLEGIRGVRTAARDVLFALEEPVATEPADEHFDEPIFWDRQWDKHVTDVRRAHQTATGDGSTIAVIDTGIDASHPDLQNVDTNNSAAIIDGDVTAGDGGQVHWHGTHVAGIAAAQGGSVTGMAPDATILNLRVFPEEGDLFASASDILLALEYAADQGADVANISLGAGPYPPQANAGGLRAAREKTVNNVVRRGLLVSASAGNEDANLKQGGFFHLTSSVAGAMSVSATGPDDLRAFYSNYGSNDIAVGAPGGGYETSEKTESTDTPWPYPHNLVFSTLPGPSYGWAAGTSMAAPQVTGAAALVHEVAPDANARQVEQAIKNGADLVNGQNDDDLGAGRLNAADALDALRVR